MNTPTQRKRKRRKPTFKPRPPRAGWNITEWCVRRGLGRTEYYELAKIGKAPLTLELIGKRIITQEADERWLREREAEALAAREVQP